MNATLFATGELLGTSRFFGLIGSYIVVELGTIVGTMVAGQGSTFVAVVPYLVGYDFNNDFNYVDANFRGFYGPPSGILFLTRTVDGSFIPAFGTAIGLSGYPHVLYLSSLVGAIGTTAPVTARLDQSFFVPHGTRYQAYLEVNLQCGTHEVFSLAKFPTALLASESDAYAGPAAIVYAGYLPDNYRSFLPTQQDFLEGEWIYLPQSHVLRVSAIYMVHVKQIREILIGSAPLYFQYGSAGDILVTEGEIYPFAISEKEATRVWAPIGWTKGWIWSHRRDGFHFFHRDRFKHFDGVIMPQGWIKCAFYLRLGSTECEFHSYYDPDGMYEPSGATYKKTLPVYVFGIGSFRIGTVTWDMYAMWPGYDYELCIDTAIPIPQATVTTFRLEQPVMKVTGTDGSSLVAQACIAFAESVEYYPDVPCGDFYAALYNLLQQIASTPSFKVILDATDGPFIAVPIGGEKETLCELRAHEPVFGPFTTGINVANRELF